MTQAIKPWTCPTCNTAVGSAFCPACGERPVGPPRSFVSRTLRPIHESRRGRRRTLRSVVLALAALASVLGYRFLIFVITLYVI